METRVEWMKPKINDLEHKEAKNNQSEEKEQEIGNLFEKVMKENFPNLVKEIDMQVQEAQKVPNKMDAKGPLQDTS